MAAVGRGLSDARGGVGRLRGQRWGTDSRIPGGRHAGCSGRHADARRRSVIVPADALAGATTVRVAADSVGAPPPPDRRAALSPSTPSPARRRLREAGTPAHPVRRGGIAAGAQPVLLKAQPGSDWVIQSDTERDGGALLVGHHVLVLCRHAVPAGRTYTANSCPTRSDRAGPDQRGDLAGRGTDGEQRAVRAQPAGVDATITQPAVRRARAALYGAGGGSRAGLQPHCARATRAASRTAFGAAAALAGTAAHSGHQALNGTVSLQLRSPAASPYVWQPSLGNFCASGDEPQPTPDPAARPALKRSFPCRQQPGGAGGQHPPGTPVSDLAPLISVQPNSQTVAEACRCRSSASRPQARRRGTPGSQLRRRAELGRPRFPSRSVRRSRREARASLNDPPCERLRLPADPALVSGWRPCGRTTNTDCTANLSTTLRMNGRKLRAADQRLRHHRLERGHAQRGGRGAAGITQPPPEPADRRGQTAGFTVVASGLPGPEICWQSRASDTALGRRRVQLRAAAPTTSALGVAAGGTQYRAVARSSAGSVPAGLRP